MKTGFLVLLMVPLLAVQPFGAAVQPSQADRLLQRGIQKESVDGDLKAALELYKNALAAARNERPVAAEALLRIGQCHEKLGSAEARAAYEQLLRDYPDQADKVQVARQRLSALDTARANGPVARRLLSDVYVRAVSPDERYAVYMDSGDVFRLRDLRTEKDTAITKDISGTGTFNFQPVAISPDNKYLAYAREEKGANELCISTLDGSRMRTLHRSANKATVVIASAWTSDGKKLIVAETGDFGITFRWGLLDVEDGSMKYFSEPQRLPFNRWGLPSSNGRFIAYSNITKSGEPPSSSLDVFLYDMVTERNTPVLSGPTDDAVLGWSPTGRELLFIRSAASKRDVWSIAIEDGKPKGEPQLIKSDLGNGEPLLLGRKGVLYQLLFKQEVNSFVADFDISAGKVSLPGQSINARQMSFQPRWSPDGQFLYYAAEGPSPGASGIVIRSENSGTERRLSAEPGLRVSFAQGFSLSPDNRSLAVTATDKDSNYGVYVIDMASGLSKRIIDISNKNNPVIVSQNWSPDGKAMYYKCRAKETPDSFVVMRKNLETGEERQIYQGKIHTRDLTLSPDGTRFAFFDGWSSTGKPYVLMSMDVASGEIRELDRPEPNAEISLPAWSADGRHVLYCKKGKQDWELWQVPADGGKPERLATFRGSGSILAMAIHPKGQKIAYSAMFTTKELWALENFLPK